MITEIFNCLHSLCFQPFFKENLAAHCMKPTDSFSVSYVLCRYPIIPVPSPDCTLPPCTQTMLCVCRKETQGWWNLSCCFSRALLCSQVGSSHSSRMHLGRAWLVVMSEDSKSGIPLLFQAMPGTVTLNKSLHQLLRYRLCKEELGCFNPFRNKGLHVFKYWINDYLDYFFPYLKWMLYPRTMKIHKLHCYKNIAFINATVKNSCV